MPGEFEVKLSRLIVLGRCYRLGDLLFMHPMDWERGPEHISTLKLIDLGDSKPISPLFQPLDVSYSRRKL